MTLSRHKAGWPIVAGLLAAVGVSGCASSSTTPGMRLQAQPKGYAADVPLPEGFLLVENKSGERYESGKRQELRHVYRGRAEKSEVREFYRREMPLLRWVSESDTLTGGAYSLKFRKAHEVCDITISDRRGLLASGTEVLVVIHPPPRGAASSRSGIIP
jgi:hypothetical protein